MILYILFALLAIIVAILKDTNQRMVEMEKRRLKYDEV